jgi:hypothetical protein
VNPKNRDRNVRDTLSERGLTGCGRDVGCAHKHVDTDRTVVNLDSVQDRGGLCGLFAPGEDYGRASEAAAIGSVLHQDLLGPAYTNCRSKVVLKGALVVVAGKVIGKVQSVVRESRYSGRQESSDPYSRGRKCRSKSWE